MHSMRSYLFIFLTAVFIYQPSFGEGPALCSAVFDLSAPSKVDLALLFLKEDPGLDASRRFGNSSSDEVMVAKHYSGQDHRRLNSIAWNKDYLDPLAPHVGRLHNYVAGGRHEKITTFAGATFSPELMARMVPGESYRPGYFFSTSNKKIVANSFMTQWGNFKSLDHIKVMFEIEGVSGRSLSEISRYSYEVEILYPPDVHFRVKSIEAAPEVVITKDGGRELVPERRFKSVVIKLEEVLEMPPRLENPVPVDRKISLLQKWKALFLRKTQPTLPEATAADLLRMQSRARYEAEVQKQNENPLSVYPEKGIQAYSEALKFVHTAAQNKQTLNIDLFKTIHKHALKGHIFEGYYRRRVRDMYNKNQISEREAAERIADISKYIDAQNELLPGTFREQALDNFVMTGLRTDEKGNYYYTKEDLYAVSINPYFRLEMGSVRESAPGRYEANVLLMPVEKVEAQVRTVLQKAREELDYAKNDYEYMMAVLKLQQALISIHPFQDGNGRTVKLLSDFLYLQRGIAPPLHPITNDYSLTLGELYRETVQEMKAYKNYMSRQTP